MKYCSKCGKELMDDASVCMGCGCAVVARNSDDVAVKKNDNNRNKKITLIIIAVILAGALILGGYFLINYIRAANVVKDLSGERFTYLDLSSYSYTEKELEFDDDGELTYSYYFGSIDAGDEYERDYQIKFRNGMIILVVGFTEDEYEIRYDKYGRIEGIYDIVARELYE